MQEDHTLFFQQRSSAPPNTSQCDCISKWEKNGGMGAPSKSTSRKNLHLELSAMTVPLPTQCLEESDQKQTTTITQKQETLRLTKSTVTLEKQSNVKLRKRKNTIFSYFNFSSIGNSNDHYFDYSATQYYYELTVSVSVCVSMPSAIRPSLIKRWTRFFFNVHNNGQVFL